MKFSSIQLIDDLIAILRKGGTDVKRFRALEMDELNFKRDDANWSILECIEHLNLYGDFYLPEIERALLSAATGSFGEEFRSGLLGNYFANLMKVVPNVKMKKMKAPRDKNPVGSFLNGTTIERFLKQQEHLISLLEQARRVDLSRTKTAISLTSLIRLRLGDTFRFVVYHIERHVLQAERLVEVGRPAAVLAL